MDGLDGSREHDGADAVVLGVDIGTTSTKAVAFDVRGGQRASAAASYELSEPHPGYAEQDPEVILAAVVHCLRSVMADLSVPVAGISFSSAMHSLLGLGPEGRPLTPSVTWADSRAAEHAERLRATVGGLALHRRTGTPVHAMSPLIKLMWFRDEEPELCARVSSWVGIKDYVVSRLCGTLVTDHSLASGTGLLDISRLEWDTEALALAGIVHGQLPELVPTTTVLPGLTAASAAATGLDARTPVVVGAGDGPLANLGLGAVEAGVASCSIGTSGGMRLLVDLPAVDPMGGVFCYALTEKRWAVGGAVNSGGSVLGWMGDTLAPDLGDQPEDQLLALAAQAPPGAGGLIMLPYLLGERAPHWSSLPRGAYVGLRHDHGREHLVRAGVEGVCQQLALVLDSIRAAGHDVREVRATGGFARSPFWRQLLADTLGMDVHFPEGHEGSSRGAALLGMVALGLLPSIDVAADLVRIKDTVQPDPGPAAVYAAIRPTFSDLYTALLPAFASLRELATTPPQPTPARPARPACGR